MKTFSKLYMNVYVQWAIHWFHLCHTFVLLDVMSGLLNASIPTGNCRSPTVSDTFHPLTHVPLHIDCIRLCSPANYHYLLAYCAILHTLSLSLFLIPIYLSSYVCYMLTSATSFPSILIYLQRVIFFTFNTSVEFSIFASNQYPTQVSAQHSRSTHWPFIRFHLYVEYKKKNKWYIWRTKSHSMT